MNFQEKLLEATAEFRSRATQRVARLKTSLTVLNGAGRELNVVARRHATRFVKQNSTLASAVGQDVSKLARSTYESLTRRSTAGKARRNAGTRRRTTKAA